MIFKLGKEDLQFAGWPVSSMGFARWLQFAKQMKPVLDGLYEHTVFSADLFCGYGLKWMGRLCTHIYSQCVCHVPTSCETHLPLTTDRIVRDTIFSILRDDII